MSQTGKGAIAPDGIEFQVGAWRVLCHQGTSGKRAIILVSIMGSQAPIGLGAVDPDGRVAVLRSREVVRRRLAAGQIAPEPSDYVAIMAQVERALRKRGVRIRVKAATVGSALLAAPGHSEAKAVRSIRRGELLKLSVLALAVMSCLALAGLIALT